MKRKLFFTIRFLISALLLGAALAGCSLAPSTAEDAASARVAEVGDALESHIARPAFPSSSSGLAEHIRFAVLNHPRVAAAYHEWHAAVADIAPARALPDPKLTFEADIMDSLKTLMPGLMVDFMTPGKREAMAAERTAASEVARHALLTEISRVAENVQREWVELAYANESTRLHHAVVVALERMRDVADADYATGSTMASLSIQVDLQDRIAEHYAQHDAASDRLIAARARFKASLGLLHYDSDPAWPDVPLEVTALPSHDELWRRALAANPELARMRAMVEMTVASVEVANKSRTPDFSLGLVADVKSSPVMIRPTASVGLPIWREKIGATIAASEARREGAIAKVSSMELELAAEIAQMLYMVRESDRMLAYIDGNALPSAARMGELAAAGYQSGAGGAAMVAESALRTQMVQLQRLEILRQRENAATSLMFLTSDVAPPDFAALAGVGQPNL
jgi:outer membrane protein TolC